MPLRGYLTITPPLPIGQLAIEVSAVCCTVFRRSGDFDFPRFVDQDTGGAVAGSTDCLQRPNDIGLTKRRGRSAHLLHPSIGRPQGPRPAGNSASSLADRRVFGVLGA